MSLISLSLVFPFFYQVLRAQKHPKTPQETANKAFLDGSREGGFSNIFLEQKVHIQYSVLFWPPIGTISRKTSGSTGKFNGQYPLDIAVTNALQLLRGQNFEKGPAVTRAPPGMQNMSKTMAKMST
jgi:hypothetical protein